MSFDVSVEDLLGKPFGWGGRGPDKFDCWGICKAVADRADKIFPDFPVNLRNSKNIADTWDSVIKNNEQSKEWKKLEVRGLPQPFTLILFCFYGKWHVGLTISKYGHFIQCNKKLGVAICRISDPEWKAFIEGYYVYSTTT